MQNKECIKADIEKGNFLELIERFILAYSLYKENKSLHEAELIKIMKLLEILKIRSETSSIEDIEKISQFFRENITDLKKLPEISRPLEELKKRWNNE